MPGQSCLRSRSKSRKLATKSLMSDVCNGLFTADLVFVLSDKLRARPPVVFPEAAEV